MNSDSICKDIALLLDAFHDNELNASEKAQVQQHLSACPTCVGRLAEIDRVVHSLKTMPQLSVSMELSAQLDKIAIPAPATSGPPHKMVALVPRYAIPAAAAAAILALVVGVRILMPNNQQTPVVANSQPGDSAPQVASTATQPTQPSMPPSPMAPQPVSATAPAVAEVPGTVRPQQTERHHQAAPTSIAQQPKREAAQQAGALALMPPAPVSPPSAKSTTSNTAAQPATANKAANKPANGDVEIAEVPSTSNTILNEALGISTDEDGLYDIKM